MFLNSFPTILRSFEAKVFDAKCQQVAFEQTQKWFLVHFLKILFKILLQMAVEWWEMNLETYSVYEKHSSESVQYFSKTN